MIGCLTNFFNFLVSETIFSSFSSSSSSLCVCVCVWPFFAVAFLPASSFVTSWLVSVLVCRRYCCRPVRSEKSKRRTRALASTLEPRWNQTFLYSHLRRSELRSRFLEITVWDSDRLDTGRLIGEVRGRVCVCAGIHFFFCVHFFSFVREVAWRLNLSSIWQCRNSKLHGRRINPGRAAPYHFVITQNHRWKCHFSLSLSLFCFLFSVWLLRAQVVIDLGAAPLDGEADWYTLTSHEESLQILVSLFVSFYVFCVLRRQSNWVAGIIK